jgi:hypothetical protein
VATTVSLPLFALESEGELVERLDFYVSEEIAADTDPEIETALRTFRHGLLTDVTAIPGWAAVTPAIRWRSDTGDLIAERRDHWPEGDPCRTCGAVHRGVAAIIRFRRATA